MPVSCTLPGDGCRNRRFVRNEALLIINHLNKHVELNAAIPFPEKRTGVVVVGASAGGVNALMTLVSTLPDTFPWAILVVLHIGAHPSVLPQLLSARGPLPAAHARNEERIVAGRIYVAPPDRHLLVEGGHVRLSKGPKEHFTRPAIDPSRSRSSSAR